MEEDLNALQELVEETAKKYNIYIAACSFYGESGYINSQNREDNGTSKFNNL